MFKKKNDSAEKDSPKGKKSNKQGWTIGGIVVVVVIVFLGVGITTGGGLIYLSNTSPEFCGSCHIMQKNVKSYLTSNHMDHVHAQANVQCKECHDYPIPAEIYSGISYAIGNYTVDSKGELLQVSYSDDMCLKCHISDEYLAAATDFLHRNPHKNHNGKLECRACHISHGEQINYCGTCHDNGGQRMTGEVIERRGTLR